MRTRWRRAARPPHTVSRREAETLLAGGRSRADLAALAALLAAATGRPLPSELRDRDVAMAAFVQERRDGATRRWGTGGRPIRPRPVLLAAILAVALLGSFALAARSGALPGPIQTAAHDLLDGVGVPPARNQNQPTQPGDRDVIEPPTISAPPTTHGVPEELRELCRRFQELRREGDEPDPQDVTTLARAAGGADRIASYCDASDPAPSSSPTDDDNSSPTPAPTSDGHQDGNEDSSGTGGEQ